VSCISPLIKKVARRLAEERISLGVSSLRAYGLEPELLDEIKQVRATGLTFAPEAGTQRMRDVVNKNVTEEQLHETAERVFSRGWGKMKLYFMIGLPTETDDDVRGVVETGARTAAAGKRAAKGRPAEVTVSVSTHVPKPHTPFQWAAMDSLGEVSRKQQILRDTARGHRAVKLKTHEANASVLEGIFARGDRPLADVLERAWKNGARFDSWDDQLKLDVWEEAFVHFGIDRQKYLGTIPLSARLPWSHIDVGLEDGFLAREYRKALQNRLSPPCGKAAGMFVHHDNLEEARADERRLVCYDCGVACDLTQMRDERITFLTALGAEKKRLPVVANQADAPEVIEKKPNGKNANLGLSHDGAASGPKPSRADARARGTRYRFRYEKTGATALLGHLDIIRELPRVFRRVGMSMVYTAGFHPKPDMSFGPALSLGVMSLDEYVDIRLERDLSEEELARLVGQMTASSPAGLVFRGAVKLGAEDAGVTKVIAGARYLIAFARSAIETNGTSAEEVLAARCAAAMAAATLPIRREIDGIGKMVDVRSYLTRAEVGGAEARELLAQAGLVGDLVVIDTDVTILGSGGVKAAEIAAVIAGDGATTPPHRTVRAALFAKDDAGHYSPLDLGRDLARRRALQKPVAAVATASPDAE
jgi:radical SAM-linked protein